MSDIIDFPTEFKGVSTDQDGPSNSDDNASHLHPTCDNVYWELMDDAESFTDEEVWKSQFDLRNGLHVILLEHKLRTGGEFYIHADGKVGGPFTEQEINELLVILNRKK